jgi:hypothetical protein
MVLMLVQFSSKQFFFIVIIFAGSVFLTSGKFINETNTLKYYFVIVSFFISMGVFAGIGKIIHFASVKSNTMYSGIFMICFLQAVYGLFQFLGWIPSNHAEWLFRSDRATLFG